MTAPASAWWRHAVVYQVYVRSFADSDGDGNGDLPGITDRLPYLRDLGVDAVWITPFYRSPQRDHGYDVADYSDVDPMFGTLDDADRMVARAHGLGLKVIVDVVPNHTSSEHPWFQEALAADPSSDARGRYLFRTGRAGGEEPPNNWDSVFGGPAWTRVGDTDQWYLHLFDPSQPDLDWRHPDVADLFDEVLRFWLDRGVDGFRIDVAHGLVKEEGLRDRVVSLEEQAAAKDTAMVVLRTVDEPMWDQPGVHEIYRALAPDPGRVRRGPDGRRGGLDPDHRRRWPATCATTSCTRRSTSTGWWPSGRRPSSAGSSSRRSRRSPRSAASRPGCSATTTYTSPTRYGGGAIGLARARAATLVSLALPGSAYLYQGEELGLEDVDVAPEHRQDPSWFRTGKPGRDGCRVPIPWAGDRPPYGFGPGSGQPWIPQPDDWGPLSVAAQQADPDSTLAFYRRALAARRKHAADAGGVVVEVDEDALTLRRGELTVVLNCGTTPVPMPPGELLIASAPVDDTVPPDTAVWVSQSLSETL